MRPVTFKRIVQTCRLGLELSTINQHDLVNRFQVSMSRANEILHEISEMKLLDPLEQKRFAINKNTKKIDSCVSNRAWEKLDAYLYLNYMPYQEFRDLLFDNFVNTSVTLNDIISICKKMSIDLNLISIEVLSDWCERLNIIQRNLFSGKIYLLDKKIPSRMNFNDTLVKSYNSLNTSKRLGIRLVYVSIPRIRELTCEELHVSRRIFDNFLVALSHDRKYRLELSGAPYNTMQRKSRLAEKKFAFDPSPTLEIDQFDDGYKYNDQDRGIVFDGRIYYFLAIHKSN